MTAPEGLATATTTRAVIDRICCWYGGSYDPATRSYRNPQVPGLGAVRRGRPKTDVETDYYLGASADGATAGSTMLVTVDTGTEQRETFAGYGGGLKLIRAHVALHVYVRGHAAYAEDVQDWLYDLLDAVRDRAREDPTLGSGGFEAGGFDLGEGGSPWIGWTSELVQTVDEVTRGYFAVEAMARYYENG